MQRLTHERSNGIKTGYWSPEKKEDLVVRLAEYENTGLAPDEIVNLNEFEGSNTQKYLLEFAKHRWIPVEERLPNEEEFREAYCRNAYAAEYIVMIKAADRPPENLKDMIKCMRDLADLLGYEIVGRIQVREKESGRLWK